MAGDPNYANAWLAPQSGSTGGSNQYMSYPNVNPTQGAFNYGTVGPGQYSFYQNMGSGRYNTPTMDPQLTQQFLGLLTKLSPDQLTAKNPLMQLLQQYFSGGPSSLPGTATLTDMAQTGDPISALPAWQSMIDAQQQNIGRNQADLKEQFAFAGDLQSSPFGDAMQNFQSQTTKDQNATLSQMMQQAMEAAQGRKLSAAEGLNQDVLNFTGQAGQVGQFEQTQSQNSVDELMKMLFGAAFAPANIVQGQTASQTFKNIMDGIGSVFSGGVSKQIT